jgi:hypothetical protein
MVSFRAGGAPGGSKQERCLGRTTTIVSKWLARFDSGAPVDVTPPPCRGAQWLSGRGGGGVGCIMIHRVRNWVRAFAALACIAASACGPKQVCECAALAGGMPPVSENEAAYRSSEVERCLARHGGGTTTGCPQPAGMPLAPPPRPSATYSSPASSGATSNDYAGDPTPPRRPSCPDAPPASQAPCARAVERCVYPDTQCVCVDVCRGGAAVDPHFVPPPPRWQCSPRPPATRPDGCPGEPPRVGTPCSSAKTCSYGLAETGVCWGSTFACGGTWTQIVQAPPP